MLIQIVLAMSPYHFQEGMTIHLWALSMYHIANSSRMDDWYDQYTLHLVVGSLSKLDLNMEILMPRAFETTTTNNFFYELIVCWKSTP